MATRSAVVAGSSGGIGAATCGQLLDRGFDVYGIDRVAPPESLIGRCGDSGCFRHVQADLRCAVSTEEACRQIRSARSHVGLESLIHCAGISIGGPMEMQSVDDLRHHFEVNLFSLHALVRELLPLLRRYGESRIVVVGSPSGAMPMPMMGPYASSKAAIRAYAAALSLELSAHEDPDVVLLEAGMARTAMWDVAGEQAIEVKASLDESEHGDRYGDMLDAAEHFLGIGKRLARPPDAVASRIVELCERRRPRRRYTFGYDARMVNTLARLLPDRVVEAGSRLAASGPKRKGL